MCTRVKLSSCGGDDVNRKVLYLSNRTISQAHRETGAPDQDAAFSGISRICPAISPFGTIALLPHSHISVWGFAPSFSAHVRLGERGAPVPVPWAFFEGQRWQVGAVVSHISRKTSEMWGTRRLSQG